MVVRSFHGVETEKKVNLSQIPNTLNIYRNNQERRRKFSFLLIESRLARKIDTITKSGYENNHQPTKTLIRKPKSPIIYGECQETLQTV